MTAGPGASPPGSSLPGERPCPRCGAVAIAQGDGVYKCEKRHKFTDEEADSAQRDAQRQ